MLAFMWTQMRRRRTASIVVSLTSFRRNYTLGTIRPLGQWWMLPSPWRACSGIPRQSGRENGWLQGLLTTLLPGKQVGNTHPKKIIMSTSKAFELLYMDLFGPTQYTSIGGNKYGFVIVDDYTRYTWVFFLVDKSDVFATFKSFVKGINIWTSWLSMT